MTNFKPGDPVRFIDNELNRAENPADIGETDTVFAVSGDAVRLTDRMVGKFHYSRFEFVPQYQKGDWVETLDGITGGKHAYIRELLPNNRYRIIYGNGNSDVEDVSLFIRKLSPSEVVLDFGNGIKGVIRMSKYGYIIIYSVEPDGVLIKMATINLNALTEPMKSIVTDLLAAQAKENGNG